MQSQFKFLLLTFSHLLAAKDELGKYSSHSQHLAVKMSVQVSSSEALKASKDQVRSGSSPFISFQFLWSVCYAFGQLRDSEMNGFVITPRYFPPIWYTPIWAFEPSAMNSIQSFLKTRVFADHWGRWTLVHVARIRFGSKKFEALRAAYPLTYHLSPTQRFW